MDALTFVRAARSGPTFAVMPILLITPANVAYSPEERDFLKSYQVTVVKSKSSDQKHLSSSLKDAYVSKTDEKSPQAKIETAKELMRKGLLKEAKQIFQELLAEWSKNIVARVGLKRATADSPDEQWSQLETLLAQDPKNYNFKFDLLENCIRHGRQAQAKKILDSLLKELSENREVYWLNELGIVCVGLRLFPYCVKIAKRLGALVVSGDMWLVDMLLSRMHFASGDIEEAQRHVQRCATLTPEKHPEIENMRAMLARKAGDYESAIQLYLQAFSLAQEDPRIPFNIGLCHEHIGNSRDAIKYFKIALSLSPGFSKAEKHLKKHVPET
jgi:tetratricopeptide (TPR) repeat protein